MRLDSIRVRGIGPFHDETALDLAALPGLLVALVGLNGSGKSTLVESLLGAVDRATPTRGTPGSRSAVQRGAVSRSGPWASGRIWRASLLQSNSPGLRGSSQIGVLQRCSQIDWSLRCVNPPRRSRWPQGPRRG